MRRATDVGFTLVERIAQWEREYGANIAVRDRETTYTYTELFDAARRFASCLASEGIEAGDRIVLQLPNKAESLIILFGSVMRGCIPVLALPTHRKAEISHFCSKSNASCLIVPCSSPAYDYESLAKAIKKDNPRLKCFVIGSSDQYRSVSDMRGELWQATAPHSSSILFLLPSGGTTGLPKLIPRSNFSYVYNFVEAASRSLFSEKTKYLAALSICHNLPLACPGALGALEKGGTVILAESVSPDEVFPLISSAKVTTITAVPSAVNLWMDALDWYPVDLSSLESIHVGGARFTAKDAKRLSAAFSCAVQQSYGMTEGILTLTSPEAPEEIAFTTQGFPLSENDRPLIIGQDGQPCADGEEGELIWKGPYLMSGYYEDEYSPQAFFFGQEFDRFCQSGNTGIGRRKRTRIRTPHLFAHIVHFVPVILGSNERASLAKQNGINKSGPIAKPSISQHLNAAIDNAVGFPKARTYGSESTSDSGVFSQGGTHPLKKKLEPSFPILARLRKVDFGINVLDNKMYHIFSSTNVVINDTWVRVNFFSQLTNRPTIYAKFFGELQGGIADRSHVNCWQAGCLARRPHIQHLSICWLRQNTIFLHPQRNAVSLRKYSSRCKCKTTSW